MSKRSGDKQEPEHIERLHKEVWSYSKEEFDEIVSGLLCEEILMTDIREVERAFNLSQADVEALMQSPCVRVEALDSVYFFEDEVLEWLKVYAQVTHPEETEKSEPPNCFIFKEEEIRNFPLWDPFWLSESDIETLESGGVVMLY